MPHVENWSLRVESSWSKASPKRCCSRSWRPTDLDLDKAGITVCAIHGTHFVTYARYLTALVTPGAVATDGDPTKLAAAGESGTAENDEEDPDLEEETAKLAGDRRAQRLLELLELGGTPDEHGIFVGDVTLALDVLSTSDRNRALCLDVLADNGCATPTADKVQGWIDGTAEFDPSEYMRVVTRYGKGRFAQRLAAQEAPLDAP